MGPSGVPVGRLSQVGPSFKAQGGFAGDGVEDPDAESFDDEQVTDNFSGRCRCGGVPRPGAGRVRPCRRSDRLRGDHLRREPIVLRAPGVDWDIESDGRLALTIAVVDLIALDGPLSCSVESEPWTFPEHILRS